MSLATTLLSATNRAWQIEHLLDEQECAFCIAIFERLKSKERTKPTTYQKIISRQLTSLLDAEKFVLQSDSFLDSKMSLAGLTQKIEQRLLASLPQLAALDYCNKQYRFVGLGDFITVSVHEGPSSGVTRHVDSTRHNYFGNRKCDGCFYKLGIYLSETGNGTAFYTSEKSEPELCVSSGAQGSAIVFDMRDWHSGTPIAKDKTKYMLGFRLFFAEQENAKKT